MKQCEIIFVIYEGQRKKRDKKIVLYESFKWRSGLGVAALKIGVGNLGFYLVSNIPLHLATVEKISLLNPKYYV